MATKVQIYLLNVAKHVIRAFCVVVCPASAQYVDENIRIMTITNMVDSRESVNIPISAVTFLKLSQFPKSLLISYVTQTLGNSGV